MLDREAPTSPLPPKQDSYGALFSEPKSPTSGGKPRRSAGSRPTSGHRVSGGLVGSRSVPRSSSRPNSPLGQEGWIPPSLSGPSLSGPLAQTSDLLARRQARGSKKMDIAIATDNASKAPALNSHLAGGLTSASNSELVSNLLRCARKKMPKKEIKTVPDHVKIYDLYYWEEVLQEEGDGGKVVVCRPKQAGEASPKVAGKSSEFQYVMKIRAKESLRAQGIENRFRHLQERLLNFAPHMNVMPIQEVLEDERFYYIIMEKANGGSFFCSLLDEFKDGVMPENAVRRLMKQILEAVGHVHQQGMLHRDIKPDNMVMSIQKDPASPTGRSSTIKLIDFDHADPEWDQHSPLPSTAYSGYFGTLRFNAPETFRGQFSVQSDLYSVGCILYLMMAGHMPYDDALFAHSEEDAHKAKSVRHQWRTSVYEAMARTPIDFDGAGWSGLPVCREFCRWLLAFEPGSRPTDAAQALAHEWFRES